MISFVFGALAILVVAVAVTLLLSPLETLKSAEYADMLAVEEDAAAAPPAEAEADAFIVFVSGIGSISGDALLEAETRFLDRLEEALPRARIVRDVFPYAPSGRPLLTGQRFFSWFWQVVDRKRGRGGPLLGAVLNLRNLYQVLVSADRRYGPLYSHSIAHVAADRLRAAGYPFGRGTPVILLGSSGGGQISVGAAKYLAQITAAPVSVVAFGGVMAADPGIDDAQRVVSLYGDDDKVYRLGRIVFPGRWPSTYTSPWNRAAAEGRLAETSLGAMVHSGAGGYLDPADWQDGISRLERTVDGIAEAVADVTRAASGDAPQPAEAAT